MGKIRKKTSKRGTTHRRKQIQNKVRESRKKSKKEAKKNPQWKSKKPQDPGIPNNFPYKDQLLAEIAEDRRKAAEEKERRKEEKKTAKALAKARAVDGEEDSHDDGEVNGEEGEDGGAFDGIATLRGSTSSSASGKSKKMTVQRSETEDAPLLLNPDWPHNQAVLDDADAVFVVLDAREPLAFRLAQVEKLVADTGKKLAFVLQKIDTCPREIVAAWASHLRKDAPTILFRSASAFLPVTPISSAQKGKGKAPATDAWGIEAIHELLGQWAQENGNSVLKVAVVGWANAGKSSFVNSLLGRAVLPVYAASSSPQLPTTSPYAVGFPLTLGTRSVTIIDTPGFSPSTSTSFSSRTSESEAQRAADLLLRSRGRLDRLHDPLPALAHIVSRLEAPEDIMLFYSLPAFAQGEADALLAALARAQGLIGKKGVLDKTGAARLLLRDWATGRLPRVSVPPPSSEPPLEADGEILARLKSRVEMRKGDGIVRLAARPVDERPVDLTASWTIANPEDGADEDVEMYDEEKHAGVDEEEDEGDDGDEEGQDDDEDDGDDGDDGESSSSATPPPILSKRKASRAQPRPSKKVAFDLPVKGKQKTKPASAPKVQTKPSLAKNAPSRTSKRTANAPLEAKSSSRNADNDAYSFSTYFK